MTTWIALMRGVNVGGHHKLPMADFRRLLGELGYQNPQTYIQSGNAVFFSGAAALEIATAITSAIKENFGFEIRTMVFDAATFAAAIAANPFPQAIATPNLLHLGFFEIPPDDLDSHALRVQATDGEEFSLKNGVFYLYTPGGFGRSKLAAKLNNLIKTPMTARNLRSCLKISELAGEG